MTSSSEAQITAGYIGPTSISSGTTDMSAAELSVASTVSDRLSWCTMILLTLRVLSHKFILLSETGWHTTTRLYNPSLQEENTNYQTSVNAAQGIPNSQAWTKQNPIGPKTATTSVERPYSKKLNKFRLCKHGRFIRNAKHRTKRVMSVDHNV